VKFESYLHNKVVPSIRSIALLLRNKTAGIMLWHSRREIPGASIWNDYIIPRSDNMKHIP